VRQIILNIVGNALKFTDSGGVSIRVTSRIEAPDRVHLRIEVSDTGIGMSSVACAGLFKEFSQVGGPAANRQGGTGLGLVISQRLAQSMNGRIEVESEPGKGSLFRTSLFLRPDPTPALSAADLAPIPAAPGIAEFALARFGRPLRVLLAEDNRTNQFVAVAMLKRMGCQVDVAANGIEATEEVRRHDYDVVLMDVMMPDMNGIEATRAIRVSDSRNRLVPIVAVTANAFSQDRRDCLDAGMNGFLAKPMTKQGLVEAILAVLTADDGLPAGELAEAGEAIGGRRHDPFAN
jgi:CheY-like chemotaxis protein